jgi:predicted nucleotide-binding protein
MYVDLDANSPSPTTIEHKPQVTAPTEVPVSAETAEELPLASSPSKRKTNRVFITHGKNQDIVVQLKELLTFGGFTPVVAIENETVSKPVPDKVMDEMRSCDAAVIHVGGELRFMDSTGQEHRTLNQNVLIEIGASMALYGRKFILLVEKGATLPSNLQGLYEVRYDGGKLDYESTMRLLKAFNDFRS